MRKKAQKLAQQWEVGGWDSVSFQSLLSAVILCLPNTEQTPVSSSPSYINTYGLTLNENLR